MKGIRSPLSRSIFEVVFIGQKKFFCSKPRTYFFPLRWCGWDFSSFWTHKSTVSVVKGPINTYAPSTHGERRIELGSNPGPLALQLW